MTENNFCSSCGAKLKAEDQFCNNCGQPAKVEAEAVVSEVETAVQQSDVEITPVQTTTKLPISKDDKNKLILLMVVSIIIPIVGIVLGIIRYSKKDKKSGMHYLLCGLSGIVFAMGGWEWVSFIVGAVLIASAVYTGLQNINKGDISLDI